MQEHRILLMNKKGETLDLDKVVSYKMVYYNCTTPQDNPYAKETSTLEINFIDTENDIESMKEIVLSFIEPGLSNAQMYSRKYVQTSKSYEWEKIYELNMDNYVLDNLNTMVMGRRSDFWIIFKSVMEK